jgi:hypothetical protein
MQYYFKLQYIMERENICPNLEEKIGPILIKNSVMGKFLWNRKYSSELTS